jgi:hypothetical protein
MCSQGCGRKFREEAIEKHESNCLKIQQKRKKFDSAKQRQEDLDVPAVSKPTAGKGKKGKPESKGEGKDPKWKAQSEALRLMIKKNKGETLNQAEENMLEEGNGLVQCRHCGRKFNENAHQKHEPRCGAMPADKRNHKK